MHHFEQRHGLHQGKAQLRVDGQELARLLRIALGEVLEPEETQTDGQRATFNQGLQVHGLERGWGGEGATLSAATTS